MSAIKIKRDGSWVEIKTGGATAYKQEEEPTEAQAGDLWLTEEGTSQIALQRMYNMAHPVGGSLTVYGDDIFPSLPDGISATWEEVETTDFVKRISLSDSLDFGSSKSISAKTYEVSSLANVSKIYVEFVGYGGWVQTQFVDLELLKSAKTDTGMLFTICWQTIGNNSYASIKYVDDTHITISNITNVTIRGVYAEEKSSVRIYKRTA